MTPEEIAARIEALKAKLKARTNQPGYKQNVKDIEAEIARLEAMDAG